MICTGCSQDKPAKARGLCAACYTHWQKYGTTERARMKRGAHCSVEGCGKPVKGRGLCEMHLKRQRINGTIEDPRAGKPAPVSHHPLYPQWTDFLRKSNPRPIVEEWKNSFEAFLAGVGTRPSKRHRLYRSDFTKPMGPGNFEWRLALIEKHEGETAQEYNTRYHRAHRETYGHDYHGKNLSKYGITVEKLHEMAENQTHRCAVCGELESVHRNGLVKHLAVDHDHETGAVRDLLCTACNTGLGKFRDDPNLLMKAIAYLAKHGKHIIA